MKFLKTENFILLLLQGTAILDHLVPLGGVWFICFFLMFLAPFRLSYPKFPCRQPEMFLPCTIDPPRGKC